MLTYKEASWDVEISKLYISGQIKKGVHDKRKFHKLK
jgi:hypothetical protein